MPLYPKPPKFPIMEKLPGPIRGLAEMLFPQDELPMPVAPLVAGVSPAKIPALRQAGKALVERIKREGIPLGPDTVKDILRGPKNVPAPSKLVEALEFAQRRYPRLFGHVKEIEATPPQVIERYVKKGRVLHGGSAPHNPLAAIMGSERRGKFSALDFDPKSLEPAQTVGHELLHTADRLVDPLEFDKRYRFSMGLPGGYNASALEIRADLMGEKFARDMQAALAGLRKVRR